MACYRSLEDLVSRGSSLYILFRKQFGPFWKIEPCLVEAIQPARGMSMILLAGKPVYG
jgi:hypothetical protein